MRNSAAVSHDVQNPQLDPGGLREHQGVRRVLAGVDDRPCSGNLSHGAVELGDPPEVLRVPSLVGRGEAGVEHQGHVAVAIDAEPQGDRLVGVDAVPAPEGHLAHVLPERAGVERFATSAELVVAQPPVPQVDGLTHTQDSGKLSQRPLEKGGSTTTLSADVDDPQWFCGGGAGRRRLYPSDQLADANNALGRGRLTDRLASRVGQRGIHLGIEIGGLTY